MKFNAMIDPDKPVLNHEGAPAWEMSPEMELYTAVVTSTLSPMTYEGEDTRVERIAELVRRCDPVFVARLAVYARTRMQLRSVPLLLAVELAKIHNGDNLVSRTVDAIVQRADEITELLACYIWRNTAREASGKHGKQLARLSSQIRKGLQMAFNRFDEYQFAKYDRDSTVSLRDALFLTHPKAKDAARQAVFDRIASRSLATPYTWETELSALGQREYESVQKRDEAFSAKWTELILSGRLGYMAMLRNLRNVLECCDISDETIHALALKIADRESVLRSRQLPFRFLSAYRQIKIEEREAQHEPRRKAYNRDSSSLRYNCRISEETLRALGLDRPDRVDATLSRLKSKKHSQTGYSYCPPVLLAALEEAICHSAENITAFGPDTRVVIASDVSGSMITPISPKSSVMLYDIGLLLSMLLKHRCKNVVAGIFGTRWKEIDLPHNDILENVEHLNKVNQVGFSTNGHLVLKDLIERRIVADKVMMFTDMQMWNSIHSEESFQSVWAEYKSTVAPEAKLYLFDLGGYGQSALSLAQKDVYLIAGWSDKIFDVLAAIECGEEALSQIMRVQV